MKNNIEEFRIVGLFGSRDVSFNLDTDIKILIGENGLGKTTILNALYYTLTGKFQKLNALNFDSINIRLTSGDFFELTKDEISYLSEDEYHDPRIRRVSEILPKILSEEDKLALAKAFQADRREMRGTLEKYTKKIYPEYKAPPHIIKRALHMLFDGSLGKFQELSVKLRQSLGHEIVYFPTYRRIEEDLANLGFESDIHNGRQDNRLIQFGMEDVAKTINRKLYEIKNATIEGFSSLTGELLNQYVSGDLRLKNNDLIKTDTLKIILERVGDDISPETKSEIIDLVESGDIFTHHEKYQYLLNFISELIRIYEEQKELDNIIKEFSEVCTKYLRSKRINYNESKLTLNVMDYKDNPIELKDLSSGEKQIISIFSRIYLETSDKIIVLFDEPELSLSMEWQQQLLPDIINSGKCELLIAVTHSPFIFDNELDHLAEDMNKYVKFYGE